jgi:SAM-dependent methyltransferase
MPLVPLDELASSLVCPRCRSTLGAELESFRCTSAACELSAFGAFPLCDGQPALIDFERSIVQPEDLSSSSAGPRRGSIEALPAWLRPLWKPVNRVALANTRKLRSLLVSPAPIVLVVGGGTIGNGVEELYSAPGVGLVAFDITPTSLTQFVADAHQIPLADGSVDAVVVQAVLEHVLDPNEVVSEIHRVLRPDGLVYAETPFLQQVHAGAYDFVRFTSSGHRYLFRRFDEIAAGAVSGAGTQLLWSLDHATRSVLRSDLAGKLIRAPLFWLRYLDLIGSEQFAMDNASAYYFLGRRSDGELRPREIVDYYRGAQRSLTTE